MFCVRYSVLIIGIGGYMAEIKANPCVVTVFYPGMFNTQAQAAKLVGPEGFDHHHTGEKIRALRAINTIINLLTYHEIEEVELLDVESSKLWYLLRPMALFWLVARRASHWYNGISMEPLEGHSGTGRSIWTHAIKLRLMSLGQERDVAEHHTRVSLCRADHPDAHMVIYGVSRGALTSFIAHATHQYEGVRALVLEGCPDSIPNVVQESLGSLVHYLYQKAIRFICEHDPNGISALACVEQFPHDVPVLFVTSEKDTVVPASCTQRLARALADTGHPHVYCLVLKNSSHEGYAYDDPDDARNYQSVAHAFYKKHGISGYQELWAEEGAELLRACQLNVT